MLDLARFMWKLGCRLPGLPVSLAACCALAGVLVGATPAVAIECEQWLQVPLVQKRKAVLQSFQDSDKGRSDAVRARCLNQAASSMTRELDAACREGRKLATVWSESGLAWAVTCAAVMARSAAGDRVTLEERKEIRAAWDACVAREGEPEPCRAEILLRYALQPQAGDVSECGAYARLGDAAQMSEARDRIQMRFSVSMEVAECLQGFVRQIAYEVRMGCTQGSSAEDAWEDALSAYTDRCLERDTGY